MMRRTLRALAGPAALAALARVPLSLAEPAPLVVSPSESWQGVDGSWSTFSIHVGTPVQVVDVLVSTSFYNTALVLNDTCSDGPTSECATSRGGVYSPGNSTTWHYRGIFNLFPELNYTTDQDRGEYGLDTLGLGFGDVGPNLDGQVVSALRTTDYYIGMLGIDPQATNWTANFTDYTPSFFKTLYTQGHIPSLSYSYTAGALYQLKKVTGSLIFGGYDTSRVQTNNMSFTMATDVTADLVLAIQSLTATTSDGKTEDLLTDPVFAKIDSTMPYLVLPLDVCLAFEKQFELVWNPDAGHGGLYTMTDSQYSALLSSNPNFTFSLGNLLSGDHIDINIPYAAFDLTANSPFVNDTTRYFPLLRAANDSQITIGRAFLQEAMLVADYGRGNFSIYQCVWNEDASQSIETIHSSNATSSPNATSPATTSDSTSSNQTLTIGLGVGVGAGVPLILAALLFLARWKRVWPFHKVPPPVPPKPGIEPMSPKDPELDSQQLPPGGMTSYRGSPGSGNLTLVHEADSKLDPALMGFYHPNELAGSSSDLGETAELPTSPFSQRFGGRPYHQRLAHSGPESLEEVEGSEVFTELPGSHVSSAYLSPGRVSASPGLGSSSSSKVGSVSSERPSRSSRGGVGASRRGSTRRTSSGGVSSPLSGVSDNSRDNEYEGALQYIVSAATETNPNRLFAGLR